MRSPVRGGVERAGGAGLGRPVVDEQQAARVQGSGGLLFVVSFVMPQGPAPISVRGVGSEVAQGADLGRLPDPRCGLRAAVCFQRPNTSDREGELR
jgi:hypothetical protein